MDLQLTFDALPVVAAVLAVVGFFVPKFSQKYKNMASDRKQLIYAGAIVLVAVSAALLSYFEFLNVYSGIGWRYWVWAPLVDIVIGLMTSAGVYKSFNYVADKGSK